MLAILLISALGIFCLVMEIIFVIGGFIFGWMTSDFFIPLRDYWSKSGATIFGIKLSIAIGSAYATVVFGSLALKAIIEYFMANMGVLIAIGIVLFLILVFIIRLLRKY